MNHDIRPFETIISESTSLKPIHRPDLTQVRGSLTLIDRSVLHIRENHILSNGWIDYSYQWQTIDHQLIIRWDNAHDIPNLSTSPHHQHVGSEENILPSQPMALEMVLAFIAARLTAG